MNRLIKRFLAVFLTLGIIFTPTQISASSYARSGSISAIRNAFPVELQARAIRIAKCESTLNPRAVHKNGDGTHDLGLFQINTGGTLQSLGLSWDEAFNADSNAAAAYRLYKRSGGWRPWVCSRKV